MGRDGYKTEPLMHPGATMLTAPAEFEFLGTSFCSSRTSRFSKRRTPRVVFVLLFWLISGVGGIRSEGVLDGPATLFSHLEQLVLHAEKDTAKIDRIHSVEFFTSGISSFNGGALHTRIVERRIQTPKC